MKRRTLLSALAAISVALVVIVTILILTSRTAVNTDSRFCLGTYCTITVYGNPSKAKKAISAAWDSVTALENRISVNLSYSEISEVNRSAGSGVWTEVSEDTYNLVSLGLELKEKTRGALDIGLGRLIDLWAIGTSEARVPSDSEIREALSGCNVDDILSTKENGRFFIQIAGEGTRINLGSIGKGYAADIAAGVLRSHGIQSALIDFGGNLYALGRRNTALGSRAFTIGLQEPEGDRGDFFTTLKVNDRSVVTSGSYERFVFGTDGHAYSHILDPSTGWGIEGDIKSVSVVGPSSVVCDALSTSLFILGPEKGKSVIESCFSDCFAFFLLSDGSVVEVGNMDVLQ